MRMILIKSDKVVWVLKSGNITCGESNLQIMSDAAGG